MTGRTATSRAVSYPRQPVASRHRCARCREWTLTGLDGSVCGLVITVDPVALDPVGEMVALLAGLRTVALAADGRLERRGPREIRAGQSRPVLAEHRCGRINIGKPASNRKQPAVPPIHGPGDEPPF
jgi:hypothetical protein